MLPQLGFPEMIVLVVLALIVVGPEDLPKLMRKLGGFMARIRAMGHEFKEAFNEMGDATEMAELRKEIEELKQMGNLANMTGDDLGEDMRKLDSELREVTSLDSPKIKSKSDPDSGGKS